MFGLHNSKFWNNLECVANGDEEWWQGIVRMYKNGTRLPSTEELTKLFRYSLFCQYIITNEPSPNRKEMNQVAVGALTLRGVLDPRKCNCDGVDQNGQKCYDDCCVFYKNKVICSESRCGPGCMNKFPNKFPEIRLVPSHPNFRALKACEDIKVTTPIMEVIGEVLQGCPPGRVPNRFPLSLVDTMHISTEKKSNLARFLFHSETPNCHTQDWLVNGEVRVMVVARRDIKFGEDLSLHFRNLSQSLSVSALQDKTEEDINTNLTLPLDLSVTSPNVGESLDLSGSSSITPHSLPHCFATPGDEDIEDEHLQEEKLDENPRESDTQPIIIPSQSEHSWNLPSVSSTATQETVSLPVSLTRKRKLSYQSESEANEEFQKEKERIEKLYKRGVTCGKEDCEQKDRIFNHKGDFIKHMMSKQHFKTEVPKWMKSCPVEGCGFTYSREQHYLAHKATHESESQKIKWRCSKCSKILSRERDIKRHVTGKKAAETCVGAIAVKVNPEEDNQVQRSEDNEDLEDDEDK